jgi:hypothetical protein
MSHRLEGKSLKGGNIFIHFFHLSESGKQDCLVRVRFQAFLEIPAPDLKVAGQFEGDVSVSGRNGPCHNSSG